jgi:type I restriction enzyme S subunit
MRRNGRLFAQRNQTGFARLPILEVSLKTGVRVRDFDSATRKQVLSDKDKYKRACCGDVAYNMMRLWQGAVGVAPVDGLVSPAYVVARPLAETNARYFEYVFRTDSYKSEINKFSRGIVSDRNRLYWEDFKQMPSPVPPLEVQAAIVRFLDHADRRIRRYIRGKQKLIAVLNEQKQAIIHSAVTRGLDPKVRLKPSGIEWLGHVPEHWEVARFGRLITMTTGFPFKSEGFTHAEVAIRLLRGINISPGRLRWNDIVRWPAAHRGSFAEFELAPGDIVLGMDRPIIQGGVRVAVIGESDAPSLLLQRVARIRPCDRVGANFVLLIIAGNSLTNYLAPIFTGISVPHLSPEQVKAFRLALPSRDEQQQIVEQVAANTSGIQSAVERTDREISLLREYRTRLIADVVAGKLDVRKVAAELPAEADEPESLDTVEVSDDVSENAGDSDNADLESVDETALA